eukprot:2963297-Pyramimonas_sp.AAC.1
MRGGRCSARCVGRFQRNVRLKMTLHATWPRALGLSPRATGTLTRQGRELGQRAAGRPCSGSSWARSAQTIKRNHG